MRLPRGSRVGSYVVRQARTLKTRASFLGSSGRAAMFNREMSVRGGRRHHRPNYGTAYCAGRRLDSTTKEEGDRGVDEWGRDGMNSPCARSSVFKSEPKARGAFFFPGRGRRRIEWEVVATRARAKERADGAKATRRPRRKTAGRPTETHDRRAHHHESSHRFSFLILICTRQCMHLLFTSLIL